MTGDQPIVANVDLDAEMRVNDQPIVVDVGLNVEARADA